MTARIFIPEEDITCSVCCDIFRNPVTLKCSHTFCERCLQHYWETQGELLCPVCRKQCSSEEPTKSLAFKNLCDNYKNQEQEARKEDYCSQHGEKLKLFCFQDKQPICVVCYTSKKHKNHECSPIVEAVEDLKREMNVGVSTMLKNIHALNKTKEDYQTLAEAIMAQSQSIEKQIRQEFENLHQVLREQEEAKIAALKEEEMQKYQKTKSRIEKLSREILSVSETVEVLRQEMNMEDIAFLQSYSTNQCRTQHTLPEPDMICGIDAAKHLGFLNLSVRAKMHELFQNQEPPVTLDPNTACNKLLISEDHTSLSYTEEKQKVPDNPERFLIGVLGSQGFSSGRHCWDVEVGDNDHWTLGVVSQSVERKKLLKMDPSCGLWSVRFIAGKYRAGVKARTELKVTESPRVIRVELDYDEGRVTFSDPTKSHALYAFTCTFTETMFPYFNTASSICPLHIS
ncbi:zinc-binding protein A33 [Chanos chanos]|uniref:Zinc-binding protein A33 n=1 Tax=Chanos chanos TaxID=29144 RepID=A0A6J2W104_CHACN|nr:zinc-binding protein A33-like [Chanos chanos]